MKREQTIHALYTQKVIGNIDLMELLEKAGYKDYSISAIIDRITDAILAIPIDVPSGDIQTTAYNEALEKYLKEGINRSATANDVINCDRGNVEQLAADSFFEGAIWMRNEIIKRNK